MMNLLLNYLRSQVRCGQFLYQHLRPGKWLVPVLTGTWTLIAVAASCTPPPTSVGCKLGPYTAKFKNGAEVRIRFVGNAMSDNIPSWNPDGTPTKDGPNSVMDGRNGRILTEGFTVCFEYKGLPKPQPNSITTAFLPAKLAGLVCQGGYAIGSNQAMTFLYKFHLPTNLTQSDFEASVGMGEFREVASSRKGAKRLKIKEQSYKRTDRVNEQGKDGKIHQVERTAETKNLDFELPRSVEGKQWSLSAVDSNGKPQRISGVGDRLASSRPDEMVRDGFGWCETYPGAKLTYILKVRDYEWVRFKNVRLKPNR